MVNKRVRQVTELAGMLAQRPGQVKHLPRLMQTVGKSPIEARTAWLAFDVLDWLDDLLDKDSVVFEYGGGGSTAYFADRVKQVISVEHDREWATALHEAFADDPNVTILDVDASPGYADYIAKIGAYPTDHFDLVLVDGRERLACLERSIPHVKPGGWLLLDDTDRERYRPAFDLLREWECRKFQGVSPYKTNFGHSAAWRKPIT